MLFTELAFTYATTPQKMDPLFWQVLGNATFCNMSSNLPGPVGPFFADSVDKVDDGKLYIIFI